MKCQSDKAKKESEYRGTMKAPIALFVYNRPEHTKRTIEALINNDGAKDSELFIFSDGPKDQTEEGKVREVREYLEEIQHNNYFSKMTVYSQGGNQGLEKSIISGVGQIINQYGKAIVLEDDIITTPDFLLFMNKALDAFEKDPKVWSISTGLINNRKIKNCKEDILWTYRGECWGWASWADRWNRVDWSVGDYKEFEKSRKRQRTFNRGGRDMSMLLRLQQEGEIHSWAIRWCYQEYKENMITIFPKNPKSYNIGLDGSGTNCSDEAHIQVEMLVATENDWNFDYFPNNKTLVHEFRKMYFVSYWRQKIGKLWYNFTEYEYCLAYKYQKDNYQILKPNYKEWYADPIPYYWNNRQYVFMEVYDKYQEKGRIGLSVIDERGRLSRPRIILEETFHLSFPFIFEKNDVAYMMPECSEVGQIRIYRMQKDLYHWTIFKVFENVGEVVDSIIYEQNDRVFLVCCEVNSSNKHQTRLKQYEIMNFGNESQMILKENWVQKEYSYSVRNGGAFINDGRETYRIAQQSTDKEYGKSVIINHIQNLNENTLEEEYYDKISLQTENLDLPVFLYRKWGIHTYGVSEQLKIIDLHVQRFSIGGLLVKIYRRICCE